VDGAVGIRVWVGEMRGHGGGRGVWGGQRWKGDRSKNDGKVMAKKRHAMLCYAMLCYTQKAILLPQIDMLS